MRVYRFPHRITALAICLFVFGCGGDPASSGPVAALMTRSDAATASWSKLNWWYGEAIRALRQIDRRKELDSPEVLTKVRDLQGRLQDVEGWTTELDSTLRGGAELILQAQRHFESNRGSSSLDPGELGALGESIRDSGTGMAAIATVMELTRESRRAVIEAVDLTAKSSMGLVP
ncbi:MAG: hypothetical protein ACO31E_03780, partial [Phycisphaerales bacterium]